MQSSLSYRTLSLDTIINSAFYFVAKWTPYLKRNQSRDVLRLVINKLYGVSCGSMLKSRVRASQQALGDTLELTREWVCKLIKKLTRAGWLITDAPRLPNGKQEITTFRPGGKLKKLLVMLYKSKQRSQENRVNDQSQKVPTKEEREKSKLLFGKFIEEVSQKLAMNQARKR